MLGYFMSSDIVGIYSAAVPMGELLTLFSRAFLPIFIPLFTELISQNKNQDIRNLYRLATRWMTAATFPILIAVLVSPGHVLNILFGSRYLDAVVPLQFLALGYFLPICMGPNNALLTSLGRPKIVMVNSIVVYGMNVCLNLVLIPSFGIIGAATATAVSLIAHRLIALIEIFIITKNHPFDCRQIKTLLAGIISGALYFFLINRFAKSPENIEVFLVILAGITLLYGLLLLLLKTLNKDDLMIFKSIKIVLRGQK
jgi:O-antigen/teichoic acid export membrane protein